MKNNILLIVEDEEMAAVLLKKYLKKLGYDNLHVVSTGQAAIDITNKVKIDLIFMDIALIGDIDGIEAFKEIKKKHDMPVIITTGYQDNETKKRIKKINPYAYFIKPLKLEEIGTLVNNLFNSSFADE